MNELHVRLHLRAARSDIIGFEGLCRHHLAKLLAQPFLNRDREQVTDRLHRTDANGFVRRCDRRAEITTRWLEARERRPFACAMHADQGVEEEPVSQLPRLRDSTRGPRVSVRRSSESLVRPAPGPNRYQP